jgi:hypothetical protein
MTNRNENLATVGETAGTRTLRVKKAGKLITLPNLSPEQYERAKVNFKYEFENGLVEEVSVPKKECP